MRAAESTAPPRGERVGLALLAALAVLTFFLGLGSTALWDQDETKYAGLAREMVRSGEWFTMRWNGEDWFVHPPLYPWLVAITGAAFGFSEFVVRFYAAFFAAAAVALTGLMGRGLYGERTGLYAAVILATTLQWFGQARLAVFDSMLFFLITLGVWCWWRGYHGAPDVRRRWYLLAFASAGIGTVVKGPVAGALPALALAAYLGARRDLGRIRELPWLAGLTLYAAIGLSWYVAEYLRHGAPFLRRMIGYYVVTRYVGTVEGQHGPVWYYLPVVMVGQFPWTAFLPAAAAWHWRRRSDPASTLLLVWCGFTFAFFSLAGTKLPNYVLGMYPFLAIAMARVFVASSDGDHAPLLRAGWWSLLAVCAGLFAGVAIYGNGHFPAEVAALIPSMIPAAMILVAGIVGAAAIGLRGAHRLAFGAVAATMIAFTLSVVLAVLPAVERHRPTKSAALQAAALIAPGEVPVGHRIPNGIVYYSGRDWVYTWDLPSFRTVVCAHPRPPLFVVVDRDAYEEEAARVIGDIAVMAREVGKYRLLRVPAARDWVCGPRV
jgi:4-amino-4-deoxy-L-arabinose transferase-like glycosyltransferase